MLASYRCYCCLKHHSDGGSCPMNFIMDFQIVVVLVFPTQRIFDNFLGDLVRGCDRESIWSYTKKHPVPFSRHQRLTLPPCQIREDFLSTQVTCELVSFPPFVMSLPLNIQILRTSFNSTLVPWSLDNW